MGSCSSIIPNVSPTLTTVSASPVSRNHGRMGQSVLSKLGITVDRSNSVSFLSSLSPSGSFYDIFSSSIEDTPNDSLDLKKDLMLTEEVILLEPELKEVETIERDENADKLQVGHACGGVGLGKEMELKPVEGNTKPTDECGEQTEASQEQGAERGVGSLKAKEPEGASETRNDKSAKRHVRFNDEVDVFILPDEEVEVCDAIDKKVIEEIEMEYGVYMMI